MLARPLHAGVNGHRQGQKRQDVALVAAGCRQEPAIPRPGTMQL